MTLNFVSVQHRCHHKMAMIVWLLHDLRGRRCCVPDTEGKAELPEDALGAYIVNCAVSRSIPWNNHEQEILRQPTADDRPRFGRDKLLLVSILIVRALFGAAWR